MENERTEKSTLSVSKQLLIFTPLHTPLIFPLIFLMNSSTMSHCRYRQQLYSRYDSTGYTHIVDCTTMIRQKQNVKPLEIRYHMNMQNIITNWLSNITKTQNIMHCEKLLMKTFNSRTSSRNRKMIFFCNALWNMI